MANERNFAYRLVIGAKDEASAVFGSLRRNAAGLGAAIAGYFGIRLFTGAIDDAREFEAQMSTVGAVLGAGAADMERLEGAAREMGATTRFTATEAGQALESLARAGLTASDAIATLPSVLALAQGNGIELAEASSLVTRAVQGMGLEFAESARVADVLTRAAQSANTDVTGLGQALSFAAPTASALGLSLEDTAAIVGQFANAGIDASRAGTALNSILSQFSNPASTFRRELGEIGIVTEDFNAALGQLAASGPAGRDAILAVGQEAGPALRALLGQGIGALDELRGKLLEAGGAADAAAQRMDANFDGAVRGLASAWESFKIALADPVLDVLGEQFRALADRIRSFVSSGAAQSIGEAFREAFQAAGKWLQEFLGQLDFDAIVARIRAFADETGAFFESLGEKARTAGDAFNLLAGIMRTGFNVVLGTIFKVAESFSGVASNIVEGVGTIATALSRITFGDLSDNFRRAAEDIARTAGGIGAAAEAFGDRSRQAFRDALDGADQAALGWDGLTASVDGAGQAAERVEPKVGDLGRGAAAAGVEVGKLGTAAGQAAGEISRVGDAAGSSGAPIRALGQDASETAARVEQAFKSLGVSSSASLSEVAAKAKADYETIRASGTATAADLQAAFIAYAKKAIDANGGVVSEALKTEAAMRGISLEADGAGSAIAVAMDRARGSVESLGRALDDVGKRTAKVGVIGADSRLSPDGAPERGVVQRDVSTDEVDLRRLGAKAGLRDSAELDRFEALVGDLLAFERADAFQKLRASTGPNQPVESKRFQQMMLAAEREAIREAARRARGGSGGDVGANLRPRAGGVFRVTLDVAGRAVDVDTASQADAERLVNQLSRLQMRS
ncbi:MAG: phage tail tape measure protein [Rhodocyclaceae bacterium]|nr:phage tail tape measure protein [Rhodocyclaceae bacterium]